MLVNRGDLTRPSSAIGVEGFSPAVAQRGRRRLRRPFWKTNGRSASAVRAARTEEPHGWRRFAGAVHISFPSSDQGYRCAGACCARPDLHRRCTAQRFGACCRCRTGGLAFRIGSRTQLHQEQAHKRRNPEDGTQQREGSKTSPRMHGAVLLQIRRRHSCGDCDGLRQRMRKRGPHAAARLLNEEPASRPAHRLRSRSRKRRTSASCLNASTASEIFNRQLGVTASRAFRQPLPAPSSSLAAPSRDSGQRLPKAPGAGATQLAVPDPRRRALHQARNRPDRTGRCWTISPAQG